MKTFKQFISESAFNTNIVSSLTKVLGSIIGNSKKSKSLVAYTFKYKNKNYIYNGFKTDKNNNVIIALKESAHVGDIGDILELQTEILMYKKYNYYFEIKGNKGIKFRFDRLEILPEEKIKDTFKPSKVKKSALRNYVYGSDDNGATPDQLYVLNIKEMDSKEQQFFDI